MKKTIIVIMTICLMSFSLAYYPGETIILPNDMEIENLVYTIVGNSSSVGALYIKINSTNITITFPGNMTPDSFDIIFIEEHTREVVKTIRSGGGGSSGSTRYIDRNVTVYVPEYINTTKEVERVVEVDNIIDNTTVLETGFELWHVLSAMVTGGVFILFMMWKKKEKTADEIVKEVEEEDKNDIA